VEQHHHTTIQQAINLFYDCNVSSLSPLYLVGSITSNPSCPEVYAPIVAAGTYPVTTTENANHGLIGAAVAVLLLPPLTFALIVSALFMLYRPSLSTQWKHVESKKKDIDCVSVGQFPQNPFSLLFLAFISILFHSQHRFRMTCWLNSSLVLQCQPFFLSFEPMNFETSISAVV